MLGLQGILHNENRILFWNHQFRSKTLGFKFIPTTLNHRKTMSETQHSQSITHIDPSPYDDAPDEEKKIPDDGPSIEDDPFGNEENAEVKYRTMNWW